jgi:lipopolysaccharide transport system permease protein
VAVRVPDRRIAVHAPGEVRILTNRPPGLLARLRELWVSRSLVRWFSQNFIARFYANTWLGWWWIPLRPILAVLPRAVIFGGVLKAPSNDVPYLLFFLVGISAWDMFHRTWYWSTRCLELNRRILGRMYLPRLAIFSASAAPGLVEYAVYIAFGAIVVGYYTITSGFPLHLGANTLWLPLGLLLVLGVSLSLGLWTSVLGAQARDVRWVVRIVMSVWFLFTPVIYPLSAVPATFRALAQVNPLTAPMEMMREALFRAGDVTLTGVAISVAFILVVAVSGLVWFNRSESAALDYL